MNSVGNIYLSNPVNYTRFNTKRCNQPVSFGEKEPNIEEPKQKKGITAKKIALAALGLSAVAAGVILFKKWNPAPVKQLAQHVDFTKANNIEEAVKFAGDNFGVKLKVNGQLNTANWINESLVNLVNKTKGKVLLPKNIEVTKLSKGLQGKYNPFTRTVKLSEYSFGSAFEADFAKVKELGMLQDRLLTLYHEIGHGIHLTKSNIFNELFGTTKFKKTISPCKAKLMDYLGGKYYTRCEGETFAQIFAKKMSDGKMPDYAESVWKNIKGCC